ncbi:hypothetical protein PPYR_09723 [Photinus pyralis]|uniref:Large ribosomal subunit protein mL45 n=1 Tax=Photinus pyralis TaxID=7054 RepID=A0A5N4AEB4_PHOPY|nr:probable 39S ribosomal protein L45, mitochondrial [Photinus pyralis]KAB0795662.1 hypothetical protein PPYR_09723 [Photinus pyralis]
MALSSVNKFALRLLKDFRPGLLAPALTNTNLDIVRHRRTKHFNPKFRQLRKLKVIKVKLPKFNENTDDLTEEEIRSKMKERGMLPPRPWIENQYFISSTGGIFEPYVPPEGDGKVSPVSAQGAKQKLQFLEKKTKTMMAIRKIRSFEEEFDTPTFCKLAENIYIKAHECMMSRDEEEVIKYVTETAYPEILNNIANKTIRWKFLKNIELPRVAHARCTDVITKENIFAQITVRFHSQQVLAVYDRFGRLLHGSEIIAKDVLEYVVFEKHLANEYGVWRIHGKIIPDWLPRRDATLLTHKLPSTSETGVNTKKADTVVAQPSESETVTT